MTCGCSAPWGNAVGAWFDDRRARSDLAAYRATGPGPTARLLLAALGDAGAASGSVLDVGGGVGALAFELLARGCDRATCVELSPAFLRASREEADRRGCRGRITWIEADLAAAPDVPAADIVCLDRVVCCYPAFQPLLEAAADRTTHWFAMSVPRDRWFVRLAIGTENLGRRVRGNPFRAFVHPPDAMAGTLFRRGFERVDRRTTPSWACELYRRGPAPAS